MKIVQLFDLGLAKESNVDASEENKIDRRNTLYVNKKVLQDETRA